MTGSVTRSMTRSMTERAEVDERPAQSLPASPGAALGARLARGELSAAAAALNLLETDTAEARREAVQLLDAVSVEALGHEPAAHIIGVTGPPGVGKSTLLCALLARWRAAERSVAIIAVDPSSRRSGGALLGDRARILHDPADGGVFIRSMAAGEQLGGVAPATRAAVAALSACFDVVVVETVGVGQSETDVAELADTVAVVVQPGSGDVLQFLKAGIMEIPDVLVVTKADLGALALRAQADLHAALRALGGAGRPVISVCAIPPTQGIEQLAEALEQHRRTLALPARRAAARRAHALADFAAEHGQRGLRALGGRRAGATWLERQPQQASLTQLRRALEERLPHP